MNAKIEDKTPNVALEKIRSTWEVYSQKDRPKAAFLNAARVTSADLATSAVHCIPYFHKGVDYIFAMSFRW